MYYIFSNFDLYIYVFCFCITSHHKLSSFICNTHLLAPRSVGQKSVCMAGFGSLQ